MVRTDAKRKRPQRAVTLQQYRDDLRNRYTRNYANDPDFRKWSYPGLVDSDSLRDAVETCPSPFECRR